MTAREKDADLVSTSHVHTLAVSGLDSQLELLAFASALEARPEIEEIALIRADGAVGVFNVTSHDRAGLLDACRSVEGFTVTPEGDDLYGDVLEVTARRTEAPPPMSPARAEALARLERRAQPVPPVDEPTRLRPRLRIFGRRLSTEQQGAPLSLEPAHVSDTVATPTPSSPSAGGIAPLPAPPAVAEEPVILAPVPSVSEPAPAVAPAPAALTPEVPIAPPREAAPMLPVAAAVEAELMPAPPPIVAVTPTIPAPEPAVEWVPPPEPVEPEAAPETPVPVAEAPAPPIALPVPGWTHEAAPLPPARIAEGAPREMVRADARPGGAAPLREHLVLVVYPFRSFERVNEFQDQLSALEGVISLKVGRFYRGALQLKVEYEGIIPLTRRLRELKDFTAVAMNQPDDQTIEITLEG